MIQAINHLIFLQKRYITDIQSTKCQSKGSIKFETETIKSSILNYSATYILVARTALAFKNCAPFMKYITHINDVFVDTAENIDIAMPMYILIEYSDNYSDTSGSLCLFKRDKDPANNANVASIILHHLGINKILQELQEPTVQTEKLQIQKQLFQKNIWAIFGDHLKCQ